MKIAIGMDLHAKTAVCYAVFAGEGEPREKHLEFLEEFNRKHRTQGSGPEDMAAIAADLRGHEAYVLIENSTKTYETYWVLMNLGVRSSSPRRRTCTGSPCRSRRRTRTIPSNWRGT